MGLTLDQARTAVRAGKLVVYPTETLWGIGGDARRPEVYHQVLSAKGIKEPRPMPVLAADIEVVLTIVSPVPGLQALARHFWPGSLTLVLPLADQSLNYLAGPTGGIGLRISAHPVASALAQAAGGLLLSTSANRTGRAPPAFLAEVEAQVLRSTAGAVAFHGGTGGEPSTLLVWDGGWRLARGGALSKASLLACLGGEGLTLLEDVP
jgi:L-threonylcarbamoyladenylate synthase